MKTMEEIYEEMLAVFSERTGLKTDAVGDLAVRFYAVAAQIYALYLQAAWTEKQCFPQTAVGEYLDHHAALRGIGRKEADAAEGILRFGVHTAVDSALTIPVGTVCMTAGLVRFETTCEAELAAGELWVDVPAAAVEAGKEGNVGAGTVTVMSVAPTGIAYCTNPEAFTGGQDTESDEELRERVLETYRRLANGANAAYYEQKALTFDGVEAVAVIPRPRGIGTVDVVIATEEGVPGQELLDEVQAYFEQVREIAVDVQVIAPETVPVDVAVQIRVSDHEDASAVLANAEAAIQGWFDGKRLGKNVLLAELAALVYGVDGVVNYAFSAPTSDVSVETGGLPVLGTLTVEEMD